MAKLAVIILTKNEAENIADVVPNAKQVAEEVLIVDSGSTDETVKLAEAAGAKVCRRDWDNDFAAQRNFALTQTEAEWVLYLDADERMDADFVNAVQEALQNGTGIQGGMTRVVKAFGHEFAHGILAPDTAWRLFPRKQVLWENKVHERADCLLPRKVLQGKVMHYTYKDWHQWVAKINNYTTIWARDNYAKGNRTTAGAAFWHAGYGFIRAFILQRGFLDGWMGMYASCQHFLYTMLKYVKLYDLQVKDEHEK
jgi:glycosyltransferase involved in cell wall biosynthesis